MPRPNPPPTPGSSSDLHGKEAGQAPPTFALPPTAYQELDRRSASSATPSATGSDSSYRPMSPGYAPDAASRKRSLGHNASAAVQEDFALPPPPTRSRKIIQMKPREAAQGGRTTTADNASQAGQKGSGNVSVAGKKKPANANTTAAGRKIARKTAHSLIERRRRSKMNEEFGVLKDMIPACKGQEMHKLAILQASIEYLRYLEQCVADLQVQGNAPRARAPAAPARSANALEVEDENMQDDEGDIEGNQSSDDENDDGDVATPSTRPLEHTASRVSLPSLAQMTSGHLTSPTVSPADVGRHYSISSATQSSYSPYFHSNQPSPSFGPQLSHVGIATHSTHAIGLGSPALQPVDLTAAGRPSAIDLSGKIDRERLTRLHTNRSDLELDQEATAALLMLNNDRRNWRPGTTVVEPSPKRARKEWPNHSPLTDSPVESALSSQNAVRHRPSVTGMSVQDLLSG